MVGIAHYLKDPRTNYAETAFLVRDDWQDKGIGKFLLDKLGEIARQHGITGFTADVLADNKKMLAVFHGSAHEVSSRLHEGVYSLKIPFDG